MFHCLTRVHVESKALSGFHRVLCLPMVLIQPDHDLRGVASPSNVRVPIILFAEIKVLNGCPLDRFLFFSLFSVVIAISIARADRILIK